MRFPDQNFFMNLGPWMSNRMYVQHGFIVLAAAALLFAYLKKHGTSARHGGWSMLTPGSWESTSVPAPLQKSP
jgi:hypothetical protein